MAPYRRRVIRLEYRPPRGNETVKKDLGAAIFRDQALK